MAGAFEMGSTPIVCDTNENRTCVACLCSSSPKGVSSLAFSKSAVLRRLVQAACLSAPALAGMAERTA
jgi:hypothetical protein